MVALNKSNPGKYLTPEENRVIQFPPIETWKPYAPNGSGTGRQGPSGLVVNHVLDELTHGEGHFKGMTWESIESGGYSIYTTLDPRAQTAAEATANETVAGSAMNGQPANLQASLVSIEPGTGRVVAYYGGRDGLGNDYAGYYIDDKGEAAGVGRYPPGASFMAYTLAAALKAGISLNSSWQWTEHKQVGRVDANPIRNSSTCPSDRDPNRLPGGRTGACTLLESTVNSLNVPFYDVTLSVTPAKVLELARDVGIDDMWNDNRERQDLRRITDWKTMTPSQFDIILGIGQYPVTVVDQANAMATFAAKGLRAKAHFVGKVTQGDETVYTETLPNPNQARVFSPQTSADLNYALSQSTHLTLAGGDSRGEDRHLGVQPTDGPERARLDDRVHQRARHRGAYRQRGRGERAARPHRVDHLGLRPAQRDLPQLHGPGAPGHGSHRRQFDPPVFGGNLNPQFSLPS
jgi:membrane peptidoglycan carboxypeptidase